MADDPNSEFERIFGKTQKSGDTNSTGSTKKLPSDSDLLGIRTDSDRFLVKNVPEQLPIDKDKASSSTPAASNPNPESKASQDAMTIALNVNVFANLGKSGRKPGESGADGPTFVIPLSKEALTSGIEIQKSASKTDAERKSDTDAEFTRIMQIKDSVKVPKPKSFFEAFEKQEAEEPAAAAPETKPAAPEPAPPALVLPGVTPGSGPSDFTKVVKGSEMRTLQEKLAAAAANMPGGTAQPWQSAPPPNLPQYVPAPNATLHQRTPPAAHPSKLSQYMPLIIGLNVLVLLVILLIAFFALKK